MTVEQAIYGEIRGGHALRMASRHDSVAVALTPRLDLPDTAPPGVEWSPYVSGFPHHNYYVVAKTFADPTATRAGMVLSHALFLPLEDAIALNDIRSLFHILVAEPRAPSSLGICNVSPSDSSPPESSELEGTARALATRGEGPAVRVGIEGFERLVAALWFHLWPEMRATFAFRLSFGPHDLVEPQRPSLVCTPTRLAVRWQGHKIIGAPAESKLTPAAAMLCGQLQVEGILRFAREIGARLDKFIDVPLIERAYAYWNSGTPSFEECVSVLRLVERLSPDAAMGQVGKARIVESLTSRLPRATAADVMVLRNVTGASLSSSNTLWNGLRQWAADNKFDVNEEDAFLSAIEDALAPSAAVEPWSSAIVEGTLDALKNGSLSFVNAFWRWLMKRPTTIFNLANRFPPDSELELRLLSAVPTTIALQAGEVVMSFSAPKRWLRLYGTVAAVVLPGDEPVRRQLAIDKDPTFIDGIKAAAARIQASNLISLALELEDPRLIAIAAEHAAREPALLRNQDFASVLIQEIWLGALTVNGGAWTGFGDSQAAFATVLDNLVTGNSTNHVLIRTLSSTPLADLSSYERRSQVWERVDKETRSNLLAATADGWAAKASFETAIAPPDTQLESVVLSGERLEQQFRRHRPITVRKLVMVARALRNLDEGRFLRWLSEWIATREVLPLADADLLGKLVVDRQWQRTLEFLIKVARRDREDVKSAVRFCYAMVGAVDRWLLGLSPASTEDKWRILEDIIIDLYPEGPSEGELWERAGGRNADLQSNGSGRARWRAAFSYIRKSNRPEIGTLLSEARRDFPLNEELRYISMDGDFEGKKR